MKIFKLTPYARKPKLQTDVAHRRSFLGHLVMGGIATVLARGGSARAQKSSRKSKLSLASAEDKISVADSVLIYASLLDKVENSELKRRGTELNIASTALQAVFHQVRVHVVELQQVVCKSPESQQRLDELKSMTEAAEASTKLLSTLSGSQLNEQANVVRRMCEKLTDTAECLSDGSEIKGAARSILDKIFNELGKAPIYTCKVGVAREEWEVGNSDLTARLDKVRKSLAEAISTVLGYERMPVNSSRLEDARVKAVQSLQTPIDQLKLFPEYEGNKYALPTSAYVVANKSAIELIVFMLEGLQTWLGEDTYVQRAQDEDTVNSEAMVIPAAYRTSYARRVPTDKEISDLLEKYCKESLQNKIDNCRYACTGVWGRIGSLGPDDTHVGSIIFSLNGGITGLFFDHRMTCKSPPQPNIRGLAVALAKLGRA